VSQAIRRLEATVGSPLIDRSSKDGTLTAAGLVLFEYAQQLLNLRRDAHAAIHELGNLQRGKVAIAANEYTVTHLLPIVEAYRARHPQVKIEVRRSLASQIPSEVLGRDVEMGLVSYKPPTRALRPSRSRPTGSRCSSRPVTRSPAAPRSRSANSGSSRFSRTTSDRRTASA
jgi:DNA-binding transcriptional LysR family regulator